MIKAENSKTDISARLREHNWKAIFGVRRGLAWCRSPAPLAQVIPNKAKDCLGSWTWTKGSARHWYSRIWVFWVVGPSLFRRSQSKEAGVVTVGLGVTPQSHTPVVTPAATNIKAR